MLCSTAYSQRCKSYDYVEEVNRKYKCVWDASKEKWKLAKSCKGDNAGSYQIAKKRGLEGRKLKKWKKAKKHCKHLQAPGTLGIRNLPSLSELLSGEAETSGFAVSGTPPTFTDIAEGEGGISSKTIFWRDLEGENIVNAINGGSPSTNQCNEFWSGNSEESSGGLGACNGVAGAAIALSKPLEGGGITMCYLQNAPSPENFLGKGIRKVSGKLPGGKITNLFVAPEGSENRIVEVRVRGGNGGENEDEGMSQNIFITVHSTENNAENGNRYKAELVFCDQDSDAPYGKETITIANDNTFSGNSYSDFYEDGKVKVTFQAGLEESDDGEFQFDFDIAKNAEVTYLASTDDGDLKLGNIINIENDTITLKTYESIGDSVRKDYSKAAFSGEEVSDLQVFYGAIKQEIDNPGLGDDHSYNTGFEFSDEYYTTALSNELLGSVQSYNMGGDSFYSTVPSIDDDTSSLNCNPTANIVVVMDMDKKSMKKVSRECEEMISRNYDICGTDDIRNAQEAWFALCDDGFSS